MYKSKFDLLFEEIMKTTIAVDTFDYVFNQNDDELTCTFDTLNADNKLVTVICNINLNDEKIFTIDDGSVNKKLTEKEFLLKFYKDYEKFKEAYKKYQAELLNAEKEKHNKQKKINNEFTKDNIPIIKSFNDKLNNINGKTQGITIKGRYYIF